MTNRLLDRTVIDLPFHWMLCISRKQLKSELKKFQLEERDLRSQFYGEPLGWGATTYQLEHTKTLEKFHIICVDYEALKARKCTRNYISSLLTHEVVHIFQFLVEHWGEKTPSSEFQAYAIQNLSKSLLDAYDAEVKKKKK